MHSRRHLSRRADRQPNDIDIDPSERGDPRHAGGRAGAPDARRTPLVAPVQADVRALVSMWVGRLRRSPHAHTRLERAVAWTSACALLALAGCGLFRGAINDSPNIRWWLFASFGAERMCPEMLKRSAPLRLTNGGHVIGRLFPNACQHRIDDQRRTVSLEFTGTGYAWTPIAGRVGFSTHAGVEYRADFSLQDDAMYVWARTERLMFAP